MKVPQNVLTPALLFLDKHKRKVGFDGWTVFLEEKTFKTDGKLATCTLDIYEKKITIQMSSDTIHYEKTDLEMVLLHELIHARLLLSRIRTDQLTEAIRSEEEEQAVNDITRGMYEVLQK